MTAKLKKMRWIAENSTEARQTQRNASRRHTSGIPPKGSLRALPAGWRSASQATRARSAASSVAIAIPAIVASAHCHPTVTAITGTISDTMTPPNGTPVCLIENIRLRRPGAVCRTSKCAAAGLANPMPAPTATEPNPMKPMCGKANMTRPITQNSMLSCVINAAPQRGTNKPA